MLGITFIHIIEDVILASFVKFAPFPLWIIYIFTVVSSIIMANYAYVIANSKKFSFLLASVIRKKDRGSV